MKKIAIASLVAFLAFAQLFAQNNAANNQGQPADQNAQGENKTEEDLAREAEKKWHNPDYRPYVKSFEELNKLSDDFAKNKFRLALSNYNTGRSIIFKMRQDVQRFREEEAEQKRLNEKWYWQTIDRKAREERIVGRKKQEAKLKSVTYYTRSINHLDAIQNRKFRESDEFKELMADVYRDWIIQQFDLGNIPQTIDLLERYIALDPKYDNEVPPHKYLASAYGFKENVLNKYSAGTEQELNFYKKKKNQHLLKAAELKYKKDSPEYEHILELVNRDEIIAIDTH